MARSTICRKVQESVDVRTFKSVESSHAVNFVDLYQQDLSQRLSGVRRGKGVLRTSEPFVGSTYTEEVVHQ